MIVILFLVWFILFLQELCWCDLEVFTGPLPFCHIKKAEHRRIDAFELWCWRILLRVPWTARRSNQLILKEISPEYLATWCKELTHWERPWCWERLKARGEGDDRGWEGWMTSPTWWTWVWASSGSWWWTRKPCVLQSMALQRVRHDWVTELNW